MRFSISKLGDTGPAFVREYTNIQALADDVARITATPAEVVPLAAGWVIVWNRDNLANTGAYFVERARPTPAD